MQSANENGLLTALPPVTYDRLAPGLKRVRLIAGEDLYDIGDRVTHAWFITEGLISLLSHIKDGNTVEVAMIGHEGMLGFPGIARRHGAAFLARVQIAGEALRCEAKAFRSAIEEGTGFSDLLLDHTLSLSEQIAQTAVCNLLHSTEQRLTRWLLLARDRLRSDSILLTHEQIAQILGVSRSGVSLAAGGLQSKGLIRYARGRITILNRAELAAAACECYPIIRQFMNSCLSSRTLPTID